MPSSAAKSKAAVPFSAPPPTGSGDEKKGAAAGAEKKKLVFVEPIPPIGYFQFYFRYADPLDILMMFVGTVGGIATGALIPYFQSVFGKMLDALNTATLFTYNTRSGVVDAVQTVAIELAYIALVAFVAANMQVFGWSLNGERQMSRIRSLYVKSILRQDISWFDVQTRGQTATVVTDLTTALQDGLGRKNGDIFEYCAQFVGGFVIAFTQSWKLTLVLLAAIPAIIVATALMVTLANRAQRRGAAAYAAAGSKAYESLAAVRTVQALRLQDKVKQVYDTLLKEVELMGYSKARDNALGIGLLGLVVYSTFGLGFFYGAHLVAAHVGCNDKVDGDCITGGKVLSTFFAVIMGAMGLGSAFPCIFSVVTGKAAAEQIFYVINRVPAIDSYSTAGRILGRDDVRGEIELQDVIFAYPTRPEKDICKNYSLNIQAGKTYALVGPSGEGKSTIMSLILRYYDPKAGQVLLDGIPYKDINLKSLRSKIGLVSQEPILFAGSIKDNIRSGKEGATDDEVIAAAQMANAHEFISSFPQGYDTFCGEGGTQLSGGQKQRICIARALIKDPAILLLDEATSALDNKSEKIVQAALDKLQSYKKRTTIVIAHRLTTIRNADFIAFVQGGKVIELGSHEELMQIERGHYAALVASHYRQKKEKEKEKKEESNASTTTYYLSTYLPTGHYAALVASHHHQEEEKEEEKEETTTTITTTTTAQQSAVGAEQQQVGEGDGKWILRRLSSLAGVQGVGLATSRDMPADATVEGVELTERERRNSFGRDKAASVAGRRPTLVEKMTTVHDIPTQDAEGGEGEAIKASKLLWGLALEEWDAFFVGLLGSMINGGGFPLLGYLISKAQSMLYYHDPDRIRRLGDFWGGMFVVLGVIICAARFAQEYGLGVMSERLARKLRSLAFAAMIRKNISWFDREENSTGALTTQLSEDAGKVNKVLGASLGQMMQLLFCLSIAIGLAFSACWQMALLTLGVMPLNVVGRMITQAQQIGSTDSSDTGGSAGAVLSASVLGIRTVSAFSLESSMHAKYDKLYTKTFRARLMTAILGAIGLGYTQAMQFGMNGLMFYVGGVLIGKGLSTFPNVLQAIMTLMLGSSGLAMALKDMGNSKEASEGAQRISTLIWSSTHQTIDAESDQGGKLKNYQGDIDFTQITFHYPNRTQQSIYGGANFPDGYSLKVKAGQTVALVGPSGGGKSTSMQLVLRFYDPVAGKVLFDGVDIKTLNVKWLRSQISYVGQEPVLFAGTIYENILNGKSHATEAEVIEAAKAAQIHEFISGLPEGYQTKVDEGSINLSGGQKQRIALARAFIGDPKILLLDEATSALDNENERKVQEALDNMQKLKPMTTLVIAHRLTTIHKADQIAVISGGGVVELGTHAELLARGGIYAQLAKTKQEEAKETANAAAAK